MLKVAIHKLFLIIMLFIRAFQFLFHEIQFNKNLANKVYYDKNQKLSIKWMKTNFLKHKRKVFYLILLVGL